MSNINLHDFFKHYDEKNLNHIRAVQWLKNNLSSELLSENSVWVQLYREKNNKVVDDEIPQIGIDLIKEFEGCHLNAYPDPLSGGLPITIGWGSTRKKSGLPFLLSDKITQSEADELLIDEIKQHFLPSLRKIPYWNEMSSGKKGALLSFAYNLGANFYGSNGFNTITNHLKNKKWNLVADALYLYRNPGSSVEKGLARRRLAEGEAWKND